MRKALNHLKRSDPVMASIIERVGPYERSARVGGVIRKGTCRDRAAAPS